MRPPIRSRASSTVTLAPADCRSRAADSPASPAPMTSTEDVLAHCKQHLAAYKRPSSVVLRDELPKSPIGKVLRKDLKAEVKNEFNRA